MNTQRYLRRIHYPGTPSVDLESLRALHLAHLRSVAFENLSIHAQEAIVLDEYLLYCKVVDRGRGGFCYELNGLFARMLEELGFRVSRLAAQVAGKDGVYGPDFDHMALVVHLADDFLVDVGFGDSSQQPLRLDDPSEQAQGDKCYRIVRSPDFYTLQERGRDEPGGDWQAQYRFKRVAHELRAFEAMCRYHQRSPASHFTKKRICSMATLEGRVSLSDLKLIVTHNGTRTETDLASEGEFAMALKQHFGMTL